MPPKSVFFRACKCQTTAEITELLDQVHFDPEELVPDSTYRKQVPALFAGILHSRLLTQVLLDRGANANVIDSEGDSLLHKAVKFVDEDMVKLLLDYGADVTQENYKGHTPFHVVTYNFDESGKPRYQMMKLLLQYGAEFQGKSNKAINYKKYFSLCLAIVENDLNRVEDILEEVEDIDFKDLKELTPTGFAVWFDHLEILELLLDVGADREQSVWACIQIRNLSALEKVLEKGADTNKVFLSALRIGNTDMIRLCLMKGADVNAKSEDGETGLHMIAQKNRSERLDLLELLLEFGADPEARDLNDKTAVHVAAQVDNAECLEMLFRINRIDVNIPNISGRTPLLLCNIDCKVFTILLENGARLDVKDDYEARPYHTCEKSIRDQPLEDCEVMHLFKKIYLIDRAFVEANRRCLIEGALTIIVTEDERMKNYKEELNNLKKIKLSERTSVVRSQTLCDVLLFDPNRISRFTRNRNLVEIYRENGGDFQKAFKHYGSLLNHQFRRGLRRRIIMESASELLFYSIGTEIPLFLIEEILGYFSENQLKKLISDELKFPICVEDFDT